MGQSELLAAALGGGFLLYLAMTRRLAVYWSLMTGGAPAPAATANAPAASTSAGGLASNLIGQVIPLDQLEHQLGTASLDTLLAASPFGGF